MQINYSTEKLMVTLLLDYHNGQSLTPEYVLKRMQELSRADPKFKSNEVDFDNWVEKATYIAVNYQTDDPELKKKIMLACKTATNMGLISGSNNPN